MAAGLVDAEAPLGIVPDWTAALITLSLDDVQLARVSQALARYAAARPDLVAEDIQGLGRFDLDVAVYGAWLMQFFGETGRPDRPLDAVLTVIGNDPGMEYGGYGINDVLAHALRHDYDQATADSDRRSSRAGVPAGESTYGSTRSPSLSTPDPISRNRWMRWRQTWASGARATVR